MSDIYLYGEVGYDFDAEWVDWSIKNADDDVTLRVHSPGGDVFEGVAISNSIRRARAGGKHITAIVDGLAASAASYMCLTADEVVAGPGAVFMVHPPSGVCMGTASDMRKVAQALDTCRHSIRDLYARRTKKPLQAIDDVMDSETWFTTEDAVEWGLADRVDEEGPDLSEVDSKWASVASRGKFSDFADRNPVLSESLPEYRKRASRFNDVLLRARAAGSLAVDNDVPTISQDTPETDAGEAPEPKRGEAPRLFSDGWDVFRIDPVRRGVDDEGFNSASE